MPNFLKRLELNGFKSFAQKTVLDFPAGTTAIVGPNGSGKSNVVDAIRWLLGERETKNLRGGKVEDLIFAGNPSRPRQGLAQASLYFENKDGFFPVDFSEVVVTREVSRDGVSRYFLNKSEVRLKDLVDFFAKVRLGTKGMIIISQGNSDLFIRATPTERREMIEEMLGLREYQIKKSQAENRLKNTQINLEKVKALIEEILPHLRSLRRQTGRWEKRGVLEAELKDLENSLFGSQWHTLSRELEKVQSEIHAHQNEIKNLHLEKHQAETHQREVEAKEPREREELKVIKEKTRGLLEKRSHIQKELGRLEAQIEIETARNHTVSPSLSKLAELVRKIKTELERAIKSGDDIAVVARRLIDEIEENLEGPESKEKGNVSQSLKSKLAEINNELKIVEKEILELSEKEKHLEKSQEQFHTSFKAAVTALEAVKTKIEEWETRNQKRLFEKERLELRIEELKRQISQAGRHHREFESFAPASQSGDFQNQNEIEKRIFKLRGDLASIGEVDHAIVKEAKETEERYEFLDRELSDTAKAKEDLKQLITELNEKIKIGFGEALIKINKEFNNFFHTMFDGGHAKLKLLKSRRATKKEQVEIAEGGEMEASIPEDEAEEEEESGIEIDLSLPKKRLTSLDVLSGGERSLVGIAALFSLISVSPPPFLVLDEIDAALDERNTRRFSQILKEFSHKTQFVIVTHNRASMEAANILYGVTLGPDGTSKILSLKLETEK